MNSHNNDPYLSRTMHIYISYFSVVVMKQYEQRQPKNARGFVFVFVLFMFLFFDVQLQRDDYLGNDTLPRIKHESRSKKHSVQT